MEYSRVVRQYSQFSSIGTGEEYALGAMSSVYQEMEDPKEIAEIGIKASAAFDRKTELPVHVVGVKIA